MVHRAAIVVTLLLAACDRAAPLPPPPVPSASAAAPVATRPAPEPSAAGAPTVSPPPPVVRSLGFDPTEEDPAGANRSYEGMLGEKTHISLHVERDHTTVHGSYRYATSTEPIALDGTASPTGTLTLRELLHDKSGAPKGHGATLELRRDGSGGLAGTWVDAKTGKSYPMTLSLAGVPPAPRHVYLEFLGRYARFQKKTPLTYAQAAQIEGGDSFLLPSDPSAQAPFLERQIPDRASLYVADVNNDGVADYLLTSTNAVADHRDSIVGAYDVDGASLRELDLMAAFTKLYDGADLGSRLPMYRSEPFVERTPAGTTIGMFSVSWLDAKGEAVGPNEGTADRIATESFVFLWKGDRVQEVGHTKKTAKISR